MAQSPSAKKRHRQSIASRDRNRAVRSRVRTAVKKVLAAESGEQAQELLRDAQSQLDRAASKKVIHRNTASRRAGRIARRLQRGQASSK